MRPSFYFSQMVVENTHKVPKSQWRKWSNHQRRVFNFVYHVMADQRLFSHPMAAMQTDECWKTTRWNAAWIAADAAGDA